MKLDGSHTLRHSLVYRDNKAVPIHKVCSGPSSVLSCQHLSLTLKMKITIILLNLMLFSYVGRLVCKT